MPTVADLGRLVKAKYPGSYDDLPDDSLGLKVQAKYPGSYDDFTALNVSAPAEATRGTPGMLQWREAGKNVGQLATSAMPAIGGFLGSIPGVATADIPLAIYGAGLGGTVGEAGRLGIRKLFGRQGPRNLKEFAGDVGTQGAIQAAAQGMGEAGAAGLKALAPSVMKLGLRVSPEMGRRMPWLTDYALKKGAKVGAGPSEAELAALAQRTRSAATNVSKGLVKQGEHAGTVIHAADLAQPALTTAERNLGRPLSDPEKFDLINQVKDRANELLKTRSFGIGGRARDTFTPSEADAVRQLAQEQANPTYAKAMKGIVSPTPELDASLASGARSALHDKIPGLAEARKIEQEQILLARAALRRTKPGARQELMDLAASGNAQARDLLVARQLAVAGAKRPSMAGLFLGGGAGFELTHRPAETTAAALATMAAAHPAVQTRIALGLASRPARLFARNAARLATPLFLPRDTTAVSQ